MAVPTRIRAIAQGDAAVVRVLMGHDMETGLRTDAGGKPVPAWHITEVVVELDGRVVLAAQLGIAVSKDPFLQFTLAGARPGQRVAVAWVDTRGDRRRDEATVTAG